jgi:hypothetical protein
MTGVIAAAAFLVGLIALSRFLRHRESEGDWDKEGHGFPEHQDPGVKFRPLEVPPSGPFD